jgi:hypothetical protein
VGFKLRGGERGRGRRRRRRRGGKGRGGICAMERVDGGIIHIGRRDQSQVQSCGFPEASKGLGEEVEIVITDP